MPRGDRTGPQGMGSMTGRGLGFCAGYTTPGFANPQGIGRGMAYGRGDEIGRGLGLRRGRCGGFNPTARFVSTSVDAPVDEEVMLNAKAAALEDQLANVRKRISQISANNKAE